MLDPQASVLDFVALMRTGVDPMNSYDNSIPIDPTYDAHRHFKVRITLDEARSVGIADACESFEENRNQLAALAHLPPETFLYALRFQKLRDEVKEGKILPGDDLHFPDDHPNSLFSSLSKSLRDCIDGKRKFPELSEEERAPYYQVAGLSQLGSPGWIGPSIKAFAISIFSQFWQAYEVLAMDLLNDAVLNNPSKLPNARPPIEIFGLDGGDRSIRTIYEKTFVTSATGIKASLADQHLDYILAIRNLFAHKAGKTDQKYLSRVGKLTLAKVIHPNIGEDFPLTGGLTGEPGNHCFAMGYYLLREVYLWLKR